jgi:hypothetical protein
MSRLAPPPAGAFSWYTARMAGRQDAVAVAAVAGFGDLGVIALMVGDPSFPRLGHARHYLHTFILGDLARCGIRHLVAGSVLHESAGNRYFQRLLGYRVCNLRPLPHAGPPRGRRLMVGPIADAG